MTDLRKAAEMLMKALDDGWVERGDNVAIALRQALAQPDKPLRLSPVYEYGHIHEASQPEQEPVAWEKNYDIACSLLRQAHDLLATTQYPIKREWVGLTDDEIEHLRNDQPWWMVRDIEAKLKEKNNAV